MEENKEEEKKFLHPDEIRRPFRINMEAGIAKRFIKACSTKQVYVRETVRDFMIEFADKVLGKDVK